MSNALLQEEQNLTEPPNSPVEKKVRVQLDFEQGDMRIINDLVAELNLGTRAELFRSSLRALRWMVQKKQQNCDIVAITEDGRYLEPEFDFLERFRYSPVPVERRSSSAYTSGTQLGSETRPTAESPSAPAHSVADAGPVAVATYITGTMHG